MPSNKELQKELIKKNDHILRLSATNADLRTSNADLRISNAKLEKKVVYFEDQLGFLKQQLKQNIAKKVADKMTIDFFGTEEPTNDIPLGKRKVSICSMGTEKVFTVDELALEYIEVVETLVGVRYHNSYISSECLMLRDRVKKQAKELESLQTELDGYKGLSTQLYELATKDKGHF